MNTATPQSLPDGESSSAGMSVSTAAVMNAASVALSVSQVSGAAGAGAAAAGCGCALRCCDRDRRHYRCDGGACGARALQKFPAWNSVARICVVCHDALPSVRAFGAWSPRLRAGARFLLLIRD